jgi:hypothetical protein
MNRRKAVAEPSAVDGVGGAGEINQAAFKQHTDISAGYGVAVNGVLTVEGATDMDARIASQINGVVAQFKLGHAIAGDAVGSGAGDGIAVYGGSTGEVSQVDPGQMRIADAVLEQRDSVGVAGVDAIPAVRAVDGVACRRDAVNLVEIHVGALGISDLVAAG